MAVVVSGANVQPMPTPATISGARKSYQVECGLATSTTQPIPTANSDSPHIKMYLPPTLSVSLPTPGARMMLISEAGISVSPAFRAEKPSADCR